jgi:arsenate reductase
MKFYGYKRCGTSKKGEKFLTENGINFEFIDITLNPPSLSELKEIIKLSGKPVKKFFNTSGVVYREDKVKDKLPLLSEDEQIGLLSSNGKLLKRPIVFDGKKSSVAYNEDEFSDIWL